MAQSHLAPTTVAAPGAFFAEMILATVLGASHTDSSGFLFADATGKRHGLITSPIVFWVAQATAVWRWIPGSVAPPHPSP